MAIRYFDMAYELAYGAPPSSGWVQLRVNDLGPKNAAPLDKPKETSGTTITLQRARLKGRQCNVNIKQYGYHDMTCYLMALAFGHPIVTALTGGTTGFQHVFKAGGSSLLSATIRWKQVSGAGVLWFQAAGLKIKTVKCTVQANGMLLWEFDGIAKYATNIVAPTPVSDTTAPYIQPIDMSQQALFQGTYPPGTAWVDPANKFDITVDNGLAPDWIIAATRDFNRLKLGVSTATASVSAFFDTYTGSMTDKEDNSASVFPNITLAAIDTVTTITATPPAHPSTLISIPRPFIDTVTQDNTDTDTMETGTMEFGYDSTLASNISFTFINELNGVVGVGDIYTGH